MSPIESIIYMIWRGLAVGILISAPMGPVGILCIQRTLDKGRHAGFYTGVGAAISDLFYCLLTGFGLSFIEDFIERNQNIIQLVGSVVLIAFSVYLFRKDPSSPLRRPVPQEVSAHKNILGGFLFTFSNPLIIFLIIGLFARFNFTAPEIKGIYYVVGYIFIVAGALGWWYGITYAIEKVRSRFNMRAMKIMNITIGVIILIFACVGLYSSISGLILPEAKAAPVDVRYIHPDPETDISVVTSSSPLSVPLDGDADFTFDFKLRPVGMKAGIANTDRSLFSLALPGPSDTLTLAFRVAEHSPTPLSSQPSLFCDASSTGGFFVSSSSPLTEGMELPSGWCHYRIMVSPDGGLQVYAGSRRLSMLLSAPTDFSERPSCSAIILTPEKSAELRDIRLGTPRRPLIPSMDIREATEAVRESTDPMEGLWEMFDWSIEMKSARQGGEYRLIAVRTPDGRYDMLYLDGAETLASRWVPGMVKARLIPTGAEDVWRVQWVDAEGDILESRIRAQLDADRRLLTFSFPTLDTEIRFRKCQEAVSLQERGYPKARKE